LEFRIAHRLSLTYGSPSSPVLSGYQENFAGSFCTDQFDPAAGHGRVATTFRLSPLHRVEAQKPGGRPPREVIFQPDFAAENGSKTDRKMTMPEKFYLLY